MGLRILALTLCSAGLVLAADEPAERLTGEIVETSCYVRTGAKGLSHKKCAQLCAKAGIPLALLDEANDRIVWLAAPDHQTDANRLVVDHIARRVTLTGRFIERSGARLFVVERVEPAGKR